MTNNEIIEYIARSKLLNNIITQIGKGEDPDNLKDLEQDLYIELLQKDNKLLSELYDKKQLNYYLCRAVINNIKSKNSRYYYIYKKHYNDTISGILPLLSEKVYEED